MSTCVVRGSGDIGSAVAHALFGSGHRVILVDDAAPAWPRRGRAFTDAFFDGAATLEGVEARLARDLASIERLLEARESIAATAANPMAIVRRMRPGVLVDARMRKREVPEAQRGLAPLTIGLGPNFVAGRTIDRVIETAWGPSLGRVIVRGPSLPYTGVPRNVAGHAGDRYLRAPSVGRVQSAVSLGSAVQRGAELAQVGRRVVRSPLDGVLVGLTRSGVTVAAGAKIIEVDPRADPALAFGIGERAAAIARGVLSAVSG